MPALKSLSAFRRRNSRRCHPSGNRVLHAVEHFASCYFDASLCDRRGCLALERYVVSPTETIVQWKQTVARFIGRERRRSKNEQFKRWKSVSANLERSPHAPGKSKRLGQWGLTESLIQQRLADIGFIQLVPVHETAVRSKRKLSRFDSQNSLSSRPNPNTAL